MTIDELQRASEACSDLQDYRRKAQAISNYRITEIALSRVEGTSVSDPIRVSKGQCGTGTINSLGYPDALRDELTRTFHEYYEERVQECLETLKELGIDV
jgi:hypothetical protein